MKKESTYETLLRVKQIQIEHTEQRLRRLNLQKLQAARLVQQLKTQIDDLERRSKLLSLSALEGTTRAVRQLETQLAAAHAELEEATEAWDTVRQELQRRLVDRAPVEMLHQNQLSEDKKRVDRIVQNQLEDHFLRQRTRPEQTEG